MYLEQIDLSRLPKHVAIIMDGNGRWAQERGKKRMEGHSVGVDRVHEITEAATNLGLKYLTLYTFSIENWNRPKEEVDALMQLLMERIDSKLFMENNVGFKVIGDRSRLPDLVLEALESLEDVTSKNDGMCLTMAVSYSSKWELTDAMKRIAAKVKNGELQPEDIDEKLISDHLLTAYMPDPDLMIRTGGEKRISNYLLWQTAYSEFYFTDIYWPQFGPEELYKAIVDYQHRQRRFGKTGEQVKENK